MNGGGQKTSRDSFRARLLAGAVKRWLRVASQHKTDPAQTMDAPCQKATEIDVRKTMADSTGGDKADDDAVRRFQSWFLQQCGVSIA